MPMGLWINFGSFERGFLESTHELVVGLESWPFGAFAWATDEGSEGAGVEVDFPAEGFIMISSICA